MRTSAFDFSSGGSGVLAPPKPRPLRAKRTKRARRAGPPAPPDNDDGEDSGGGDGFGPEPSPHDGDGADPSGVASFALMLAMSGIATLFLVFIASWVLLRRDDPDPMRSSPLVPPGALWTSTLILALSSFTLMQSSGAARLATNQGRIALKWLRISLVLGLAFLVSQAELWRELIHGGLVPASGGYGAILFSLTGLHALHALCGLVAMGLAERRLTRSAISVETLRLCARYWHFMGALWIAIFGTLYALR